MERCVPTDWLVSEWTPINWNSERHGKNRVKISTVFLTDGTRRYRVIKGIKVLSRFLEWEFIPAPDARDSEFLTRCSFELFSQAADAYEAWAKSKR